MNCYPCTGSFTFLLPAEWDYVPRSSMAQYMKDRYSIPLGERINLYAVVSMLLKAQPQRWKPFEAVRDITEDHWDEACGFESGDSVDETHRWLYSEYCYFTDKVRPLIYNSIDYHQDQIADYLRDFYQRKPVAVMLQRIVENKDGHYYILLRHTEEGYIRYSLPLTGVQLRLYDSGVMTLSICCNHETNAGDYTIIKERYSMGQPMTHVDVNGGMPVTTEDVAWIRDAGRRLFWPYGCGRSVDHPQNVPIYSAIYIQEETITLCDYRALEGIGNDSITQPEYFNWLAELIHPNCVSRKALNRGGHCLSDNLFVIHYFNDDRMLLHNTVVSREYAEWAAEGWIHRGEINSANLSQTNPYWKGLRAWCGIFSCDDNWDNATCQDLDMVRQKCEEVTDARWVGYKTLYGICYNGMTQLINCGVDYLSQNMDWMYYQLFMLAVMQRSALQRFYREASGGTLARKRAEAKRLTTDLKQKYVQFMNSMWFVKVTEQEQGCDFFNRLQKNMGLANDMDLLKDAIEELNSMASKGLEDAVNNTLIPLTVGGWFLSIVGAFMNLIPENIRDALIIVLIFIALYYTFTYFINRFEQD